jgi:hypothetical protein
MVPGINGIRIITFLIAGWLDPHALLAVTVILPPEKLLPKVTITIVSEEVPIPPG